MISYQVRGPDLSESAGEGGGKVNELLPELAVLCEVVALAWLGKLGFSLALRRHVPNLAAGENQAAGFLLGGYVLGLCLALSGALVVPDPPPGQMAKRDLLAGMQAVALHGTLAAAGLLAAFLGWSVARRFRCERWAEQRVEGEGLVAASVLVATGFIYRMSTLGSGLGIAQVLVFFALGEIGLLLMAFLYRLITPFSLREEISENNNMAAAASYAGAILGSGIVMANAATGDFAGWERSLKDFALFAAPAVTLFPLRYAITNGLLLGFRNADREILENRNLAVGLLDGAVYIGLAFVIVELVG